MEDNTENPNPGPFDIGQPSELYLSQGKGFVIVGEIFA
jgi:hypothetical protein